MFARVWNFSLIHRTSPVTGCSDPSTAPTAGSIVWNLQRKCCQEPTAILFESLQQQQNAFLLVKNKMTAASHLHYSPGISHCYFFFFFGFHGWNRIWKGVILLTLQRFNKNRWWPLTAFPFNILDIVSSRRSGTGIIASSHRGNTMKGTKVWNL